MNMHPHATEAADSTTSPERLHELSRDQALMKIIAANPATPATTLETLSKAKDPSVRRMVVQNPNAPLPLLLQLAQEFPHHFLANPVIALLNLSQPDFMKDASGETWLHLLRCENVPLPWLQWARRNFSSRQDYQLTPAIRASANLHVATSGEVTERQAHRDIMAAMKDDEQKATFFVDEYTFVALLLVLPCSTKPWFQVQDLLQLNNGYARVIITHHPTITEQDLTTLAQKGSPGMQCTVARHPRTPVAVLVRLTTSSDSAVRASVARNSHTPQDLLHQLAQDHIPAVRRAVAQHPRTQLADLATLSHDPETMVRTSTALHSQITPTIYTSLANDPEACVRVALARNVKAPHDVLTRLIHDVDTEVRAAVARNSRLPKDAFSVLLHDAQIEVRSHLAAYPQLPDHLYVQFAQDPSSSLRAFLASNPRITPALLETLTQPQDMHIWQNAALNPRATPHLLMRLAKEGNAKVREAVAAHKRTPIETLHWLAEQSDANIKRGLASNPHTPPDVLARILSSNISFAYRPYNAYYDNPDLLLKIAYHSAVVKGQRSIILEHAIEALRKRVSAVSPSKLRLSLLKYDELPLSILKAFMASIRWQERCLVAQHPSVSRSMLQQLTLDGNIYVRAAARAALAKLSQS